RCKHDGANRGKYVVRFRGVICDHLCELVRCRDIGSGLPLPLWERVGVRGSLHGACSVEGPTPLTRITSYDVIRPLPQGERSSGMRGNQRQTEESHGAAAATELRILRQGPAAERAGGADLLL